MSSRRSCWIGALIAAFLVAVVAPARGQSLEEARRLFAEGRVAEAAEAFQRLARGSDDDELAARAHNNACVLLNNLGEYRRALEECRRGLALRRRQADERALGRSLNNLGLTLQNLGDHGEAERRFGEALEINRRRGDAEGVAVNLNNLGISALQQGRYGAALDAHAAARAASEEHRDAPWAQQQAFLARLNEGVVLERMGAFRESLLAYQDLLLRPAADRRRQALVLVNVGVVYRNLGDPVTAVDYFERAADELEALGDQAGLANAWLNRGIAQHLDLGDSAAAAESYRRALDLARRSGDRSQEIESSYYAGRLALADDRPAAAEELFSSCLAAAEDSGFANGIDSCRGGLARLARRRGDLEGAKDRLLSTIAAIEGRRGELRGAEQRAGYFGSRREVYGAAVAVLAELARREPEADHGRVALRLAQSIKGRELSEALGDRGAFSLGTASAPSGVLLEYLEAEGRLFRWRVDGSVVTFDEAGDAAQIFAASGALTEALARGEEPAAGAVRSLGGTLIGDAPRGDLWIAPDGPLHRLPFEILGEPALLRTATVRYLPSGALADRRRGSSPGFELSWLGVGASRLPRGGRADRLIARFGLEALPMVDRELEAGAVHWPEPRRLLRGDEATEDGLRAALGGGAQVLHIASHSVIDQRQSAVLLQPSAVDDGILEAAEVAGFEASIGLAILSSCRSSLGQTADGGAVTTLTGAFLVGGAQAVVATLWDVDDASTAVFMEQLYYQLGRGLAPAEALRRAKLRLLDSGEWASPTLWSAYVLVGDSAPLTSKPRWPLAGWLALLVVMIAAAAALTRTRWWRRRRD